MTARILIVDDEVGMQIALREVLQRQGHDLTVASDPYASVFNASTSRIRPSRARASLLGTWPGSRMSAASSCTRALRLFSARRCNMPVKYGP